nr:uncharacterized protein LOC111425867 [Onthophagus taurus]
MKIGICLLFSILCIHGEDVVRFSSNNQIKMFSAPLAKELIHSWIDVQKGVYPYVKPITDVVPLGEDITLFIYFKEPNNIYDVKIAECWAYDNEISRKDGNSINIYNHKNATNPHYWKKVKYYENNTPIIILFTGLKTFKFPDGDKVFLSCDIILCYKKCLEGNHLVN